MNEPKRTLQQDRVAKGLCPQCGKEAAPYRLCPEHRFVGKITRVMKRAHAVGGVERIGTGRATKWKLKDAAAWKRKGAFRADPKKGDRRTLPRLRGVPVDVEGQLVELLLSIGRPSTIEEIMEAWGQLRENRNEGIARNVVNIIVAKDKRAEKNARRAARWTGATTEARP